MKKNMIIGIAAIVSVAIIGGVTYFWLSGDNDNDHENQQLSAEQSVHDGSQNELGSNGNNTQTSQENNGVNSEKKETSTNKVYTLEDVSEKVYGEDGVPVGLTLWDDATFSYVNDITGESGMGRYSVSNNKIYLDFIFAKETGSSNSKLVVSNLKKELDILAKEDITESFSRIKLRDGDVTLTTLNQPARTGDDFKTSLNEVLDKYMNGC